MLQAYPNAAEFPHDAQAERQLNWVREFILGIRQIRGEMDISPNKPLPVLLQDASGTDGELLKMHELFLKNLARLASIEIIEDGTEPPPCATALLGAMKILVPMAGLIDVAAERQRLEKNRGKAEAESRKVETKLGNEKFLNNAPDAVVAREKSKFAALRQEITQLDEQISRLNKLA